MMRSLIAIAVLTGSHNAEEETDVVLLAVNDPLQQRHDGTPNRFRGAGAAGSESLRSRNGLGFECGQ